MDNVQRNKIQKQETLLCDSATNVDVSGLQTYTPGIYSGKSGNQLQTYCIAAFRLYSILFCSAPFSSSYVSTAQYGPWPPLLGIS
jgi:hypothetical protein